MWADLSTDLFANYSLVYLERLWARLADKLVLRQVGPEPVLRVNSRLYRVYSSGWCWSISGIDFVETGPLYENLFGFRDSVCNKYDEITI